MNSENLGIIANFDIEAKYHIANMKIANSAVKYDDQISYD